MTTQARPDVGIIGGTGFYALLAESEQITVDTPFGPPSGPVTVGEVGGRTVAFLARHGADHRFPPHKINYRANIWALRAAGVRQVLAPCAVGSLLPELGPGSLVVPDQIVDRTSGRHRTYYDSGAVHVSFADPYCPVGRETVLKTAREYGGPVTDGGTTVVIDGPRFSSRAESRWYARQGWSLVNMTGQPEATLARELALCYTSIALVTDLDAGLAPGDEVQQQDVFQVFAENVERLRAILLRVVDALPRTPACRCGATLEGIDLPFEPA
ncbi:S-methyl-5'-thioadenosine phosphorylase [Micromonospora sp. KC213]|uniref:S-methyl-5'-thioadenosine phosphorylase n=1 Tax=Micromonospora sp. KC213 TaxID=2530378 RepID=UPI0010521D36|nr:S-methyl-5'-thioadenosine phosphorylase [Micromonospora sp. KC213]TDC39680.1 S-methyl-5'-thioadenosine phosphorylase [Micromonospora sp. KC213]